MREATPKSYVYYTLDLNEALDYDFPIHQTMEETTRAAVDLAFK